MIVRLPWATRVTLDEEELAYVHGGDYAHEDDCGHVNVHVDGRESGGA